MGGQRTEALLGLQEGSQGLVAQTAWSRAAAAAAAAAFKDSNWSLMSLCSWLQSHSPMLELVVDRA